MQTTHTILETILAPQPAAAAIVRGVVRSVEADGTVRADCRQPGRDRVRCSLLQTAGRLTLELAAGDSVLVWLAGPDDEHGVVLGRIGPGLAALVPPEAPAHAPDELVIEARQQLTLRCGDGSITLRGDGKVVIQGKDLVSRAERMNRIKGGGVAIN